MIDWQPIPSGGFWAFDKPRNTGGRLPIGSVFRYRDGIDAQFLGADGWRKSFRSYKAAKRAIEEALTE